MSVLLNAVKIKKARKALRKQKKKSAPIKKRGNGDLRPPCSSECTDVWHWVLAGHETTVMFGKKDGDVWCNGYLLPTEINENPSHGFVVDFVIELDKDTAKKAVLIVMGEGNTMLTVDGVMVPHYKEQ